MDDEILILKAAEVAAMLDGREHEVLDAVADAYRAHARHQTSLPHSTFLRFPDSDKDRIIALPAYLGGDDEVAGIKWIASVPANLERGLERASAVMILNRRATGRPWAILEGSLISKQRTAASAALGAKVLRRGEAPGSIGFVGCGPINLEIGRFLHAVWPEVARFGVFDLDPARAERFRDAVLARSPGAEVAIAASLDELLRASVLVSFATTAVVPHVEDLSMCPEGATVLHISLRDLMPDVILEHHNVVDDLGHVCRAGTSIELAAKRRGDRGFVHGSLGELLVGEIEPPEAEGGRLSIFTPFGLGILDLAVARGVCERAQEAGMGLRLGSFLP